MGSFLNVADIVQGLSNVFQPQQLLWLVIGVLLGLFGGTLPGISGATMLAVLVGFVFQFPLDCMVIALAGICAASTYSGSTAGILYNVPGDAPGIPSTIEGYPMTKKGKSIEALTGAISASFFGGVVSSILVIVLVPIFLYFVNFVGAGERALFAVWAMVIVGGGALTKDDTLRGIASMGVGLFISTIGMQENMGVIRYVFNYSNFWDGIEQLWIILGIFAIPQILKLPYIHVNKDKEVKVNLKSFMGMFLGHIKEHWRLMMQCSLIGTVIGAIPGIGSVTGSWVGYSTAQKKSKHPENFKHGAVDGIIGAESANNAAVPGTFIPLLSLGIPGSASSAVILGAFVAQGIFPGPQLMQTNGSLVWTIMFGICLSSFVFVILGIPFIQVAQKMVKMPSRYLLVFIGVLTVLGTYLSKYNTFGVLATIVIGIFVIISEKVGLIPSAMLMGFILGPSIEVDFIRAYQVGGFGRFLKPVSLGLLVIIIATFAMGFIKSAKERKAYKERHKHLNEVGLENLSVKERMELTDEEEGSGIASALSDILFGLGALAIAGVTVYNMRSTLFMAAIWPYIIAAVFLAFPGVILLIRGFGNRQQLKENVGGFKMSHILEVLKSEKARDAVVIIGSLFVCVALTDLLGFVLICALFAFIIVFYFNKKLPEALLAALVCGALIWLMKVAFEFSLPGGIFRI